MASVQKISDEEIIKAKRSRWLTLRESAAYLRISYTSAKKNWPGWPVRVYRLSPRKILLDRLELDEFVKTHQIN